MQEVALQVDELPMGTPEVSREVEPEAALPTLRWADVAVDEDLLRGSASSPICVISSEEIEELLRTPEVRPDRSVSSRVMTSMVQVVPVHNVHLDASHVVMTTDPRRRGPASLVDQDVSEEGVINKRRRSD